MKTARLKAKKQDFLKVFSQLCILELVLNRSLLFVDVYLRARETSKQLVHLCDQSENFESMMEYLLLPDKCLPSTLILVECWDIHSIEMISVHLTASDSLTLAAIFTPATPTVKHHNLKLKGTILVKHLYLVLILHRNHSFSQAQIAGFQKVFSQARGSYSKPEAKFNKISTFDQTPQLPAGWWYLVIKDLLDLLEIVPQSGLFFAVHISFKHGLVLGYTEFTEQ